MEWLNLFGIILLYCSMVKAGQQDCVVYNETEVFKKQHWSGDEVTFYAYVMEDEVVNIEINYEGFQKTEFFTTLYFSPSKKYSKRIETKNGDDYTYPLAAMPKANNWIEFNISSLHRVISVFYEPNIHEIIPMNHTAHAFSDLIIKANNRSSCKDERKWILSTGNSETIPLGEDTAHHNFNLKINSTDNFILDLKIDNYTETLLQSEYSLRIENTKVTLQPLTNGQRDTPCVISQNVTTLDISSQVGNITLSVFFLRKPPSVAYEDVCHVCRPNLSNIIIILVVIFIIFTTILVIIGVRLKTIRSSVSWMKKTMSSSNCKGNNSRPNPNERNMEMAEQGENNNPLISQTQNNPVVA